MNTRYSKMLLTTHVIKCVSENRFLVYAESVTSRVYMVKITNGLGKTFNLIRFNKKPGYKILEYISNAP